MKDIGADSTRESKYRKYRYDPWVTLNGQKIPVNQLEDETIPKIRYRQFYQSRLVDLEGKVLFDANNTYMTKEKACELGIDYMTYQSYMKIKKKFKNQPGALTKELIIALKKDATKKIYKKQQDKSSYAHKFFSEEDRERNLAARRIYQQTLVNPDGIKLLDSNGNPMTRMQAKKEKIEFMTIASFWQKKSNEAKKSRMLSSALKTWEEEYCKKFFMQNPLPVKQTKDFNKIFLEKYTQESKDFVDEMFANCFPLEL